MAVPGGFVSGVRLPWQPKKPCAHPGCGALVEGRYCPAHERERQKAVDAARPTASERGYGSRWQKARATFLQRHPLCAECERVGRVTAASVVDHVVPHKGDQRLFWDTSNWQPLCTTCHGRKTATQDSGFARRRPRPQG